MAHYKLIAFAKKNDKKIHNGFVDHVEDGGWVSGRIEDENGNILGNHVSSTLSWLELDLLGKVPYDPKEDTYEMIVNYK